MIREGQLERGVVRNRGRRAVVEVDVDSHSCGHGDAETNQHLPNITCVSPLEIQVLQVMKVDDVTGWGNGGSHKGRPGTDIRDR